MNDENIYAGLTQIFRDYFGDEKLVLCHNTTTGDIEGWDSFTNINLIVAAEMRFGVRIESREIELLANVGDLVQAIRRKL